MGAHTHARKEGERESARNRQGEKWKDTEIDRQPTVLVVLVASIATVVNVYSW